MLNQHPHLVVPESDHLRIGECVVDIPRREVTCPRSPEPRRITVKALQVLLALVSHRDRVVSREALFDWVWPDTMPTNDVLTQAVAQLRKAFGDEHGAPRYLETIAKGGYRLLAPVDWVNPDGTPLDAAPVVPEPQAPPPVAVPVEARPVPRDRRLPRGMVAVVTLACMLTAAAWWWRGAHAPQTMDGARPRVATVTQAAVPASPIAYQRITSMPGSELWPSLSPDGSQVVFSAYRDAKAEPALMVQTTAPVSARSITTPPQGVGDVMPAWSPDGRQIAFLRVGETSCEVMLVPASGGEPRRVAGCAASSAAMGIAWHPDGRHLIAGDIAGDGAIRTLDLAEGEWKPLPYQRAANDKDLSPVYSPDGRWIVFQRNISVSDLWRMPAAGGTPRQITHLRTNIFGVGITADGASAIFGMYRDIGVHLARLDLASGRIDDLGLSNASFPSIAAKADALAFVLSDAHSTLSRVDLTAAQATPEPVFPASGASLLPSIAPDGEQIAFVSDRSAKVGLWWARIGHPDTLRLIEGVAPIPRYPPAWSPDSRRMLVVGRTGDDIGLYEVDAESGNVRRLPLPPGSPVHAEYMPDGQRILVVAERDAGRLGLALYDRGREPYRSIATLDDVALTLVDAPRQRILFTRPTQAGLWQADMDLRNPARIADRPAVNAGRRVLADAGGIWLAGSSEACGLEWDRLSLPAGRTPACLLPKQAGVTGLSLDRVHRQLYFSSEEDGGADVGFAWYPPRAR